MAKKRSWTEYALRLAVKKSKSRRQVLSFLGLVEAGGNYTQIKKYLQEYNIDISHFTGRGWSRNIKKPFKPIIPTDKILVVGSFYQSHKLRKRLIYEKLKEEKCEECGWAGKSEDGRIPLELDHINGDKLDNRIENLRIICPNCHSLKLTHRGLNMRRKGC